MGRSFPPCYIQNKEFQIETGGGGKEKESFRP